MFPSVSSSAFPISHAIPDRISNCPCNSSVKQLIVNKFLMTTTGYARFLKTNIFQIGYKTSSSCADSETTNGAKSNQCPRRLAAFDFDQTMVGQDSDVVVSDLLGPGKITQEIADINDKEGWMPYMAAVFRLMHQCKCSEENMRNAVRGIPEIPGFIKCLKSLRQQNCDLIIISDANNVFIEEWLQAHGLGSYFEAIFTNRAEFQANGLLALEPYHHQTDCRLSAANLCKGKVLEDFIMERNLRQGVKYDQLIYAGDGSNDICPVLRLKPGDLACARIGFSLAKNILQNKTKLNVQAKVLLWKNGYDLLTQIEKAWVKQREKKTKQ